MKKTKIQINQKEKLIFTEINNNSGLFNFINKNFDLKSKKNRIISNSNNDIIFFKNNLEQIISLKKINNVKYINKFFEKINSKLPNSGLFYGFVETIPDRKKYLLKKYPIFINYLFYLFDIIFNRILPRLYITRKIHFFLTKGKNKVISKAEILGRLYSCGFEIIDELQSETAYHFVVKKIKNPIFDNSPTFGVIIGLERIGKNKKIFKVYKLRTMHPYSEYLQEYIYNKHSLQSGGKIKNDFRISSEGKFLRKFWIDELPMIYNFLKGDLKLVGVRPLSKHYFSLYSKELQKLRTEFKPGLIPPFYVDLPKTMDEIMQSELKYLNLCKKSLIITDFKYFFLAIKNILYKGVRSK